MKERLLEFLRSENKSSAQLAEEIGVQPSGISHILSGRNNPSLDFILKMLAKYQFLSSDWLLFGKGSMHNETQMQTLFDEISTSTGRKEADFTGKEPEMKKQLDNIRERDITSGGIPGVLKVDRPAILRIVMFYTDNSFEEYTPRQ